MKTSSVSSLILAVGLASPAAAEIGLAARFGDVILENVEPGRTYNLREAARVPFGIENRGDADAVIVIEFSPPSKGELAKGYEPIPDPGWLKALPAKMAVPARSVGFFDLLLTVPEGGKLKGRHFQAIVRARMTGGFLALAVENKLRFSIGPGPETLAAEKKKKAMQRLDFDVTPPALYLTEVPAGGRFDAKREQGKAIRVANYADAPLALQFTSAPWDPQAALPEGYEPVPDPGWIVFKSSTAVVAPGSIGQVEFSVKVPDQAKYRGRKYAALVKTGLTTGFWLDAPVRVYFETKP